MKLALPHPKIIRPFALQMNLERIDKSTFRSTAGAFPWGVGLCDGEIRPQAYGGQTYAQAVWAAAQTVEAGFLVHSVTGFWTGPGWADTPFVYTVRTIRDGKGYCTRAVDVTQEGRETCYTCTCSFKQPEESLLEFQERVDIKEKYEVILQGKGPRDLPSTTEFEDLSAFLGGSKAVVTPSFPGLQISLIPMHIYNDDRPPLDRRHVFFYSAVGALPSADSEPNLHACAHLYASDRESLFVVARHLMLTENWKSLKSLSQTVMFHMGAEALSMCDERGKDNWFCQEGWTDRVSDGRCLYHTRIWDENGRHVATTIQDGLMKLTFDSEDELKKVKDVIHGKAKL
ncbi:MAG: hypothetical protein M1839_002408 [Geoglossum umbratile]|nr:MAG: hypothetical protein M1839_002408 [Geoglossum umbratile]